jgi:hypothetical protein
MSSTFVTASFARSEKTDRRPAGFRVTVRKGVVHGTIFDDKTQSDHGSRRKTPLGLRKSTTISASLTLLLCVVARKHEGSQLNAGAGIGTDCPHHQCAGVRQAASPESSMTLARIFYTQRI